MPKLRKAKQKLAQISAIGNATRGVGAGSRSSGIPSGWTVKVVERGAETGQLLYISPNGLEFWSMEAVRQHLASSRMTAVVEQQTISTDEHRVTDESGSEYSEMGLPILDGMVALWKEDMERRTVHLKQIQTSEVKSDQIRMKNARVENQQERKQWAKRQQIQHSYGVEDESDDSDTEVGPLPTIQSTAIADGALLVVSEDSSTGKQLQASKKSKGSQVQKPCRCGSTSHSWITFRDCPLNKLAVLH